MYMYMYMYVLATIVATGTPCEHCPDGLKSIDAYTQATGCIVLIESHRYF